MRMNTEKKKITLFSFLYSHRTPHGNMRRDRRGTKMFEQESKKKKKIAE